MRIADGISGDETELDLSGKGLGAGCAVLVANEVKNNGALTSLDVSKNKLRAEGAKYIAEAVKDHVSGLLYSIGSI